MPEYGQHVTSKGLAAVNLLIVEDQEALAVLLERALRRLGFEKITLCQDCLQASEVLRTKPFDLIITDWMMSRMDGIQLTRLIRSSPDVVLATTPIIMISGRNTVDDIQHARDAGITEFVAKPFSIQDICDRIIAVAERPRMFVLAPNFKGPDRRRTKGKEVSVDRRKRLSPKLGARP